MSDPSKVVAKKTGNAANLTNAGKGRPKGVLNKTTRLAKEAIAEAFDELGGKDGLVAWASADDDNLKVFYATIWPKIIPIQNEITGKDGAAIQLEQQMKESADVVTSAILGLAQRARDAGLAEPAQPGATG